MNVLGVWGGFWEKRGFALLISEFYVIMRLNDVKRGISIEANRKGVSYVN